MNARAVSRLGATVCTDGVEFRVWAPSSRTVDVVLPELDDQCIALTRDPEGYFSGFAPGLTAGARYQFMLDKTERHPDPYSRFQPDGPHRASMVVDPAAYRWADAQWAGLDPERQVVYELHIGTFTPAGTYDAAVEHLADLKDLGVTCIEVMPVNQFQGRFGWGYDGVNWFAPFHPYGHPDALRRFVDRAHAAGLGVIMDVVYNHFGHDGNYLPRFSADYLTEKFGNPWGGTPNYDCPPMRRLAIDNAAYWAREFHMDGLRLDATHAIHDSQHPGLLADIVRETRAAAGSRTIVISAEDFLQRAPLLASNEVGGAEIDQLWNDDFHHAGRVALTGNHFGFFKSYRGSSQELLSSLRQGFLFQGQYDGLNKGPRGFGVHDMSRSSFVAFTQNHDAVANTLYGQRIQPLVAPGKYRALTATLLLGPFTPLIFMGQEFNASTAFAYFADYSGADAAALWAGRRKEAQDFEPYRDPDAVASILDPCSPDTVRRSTLDFAERAANPQTYRLFKDLLALRRDDPVLGNRPLSRLDGASLNDQAFVIRWSDAIHGDRLLLVNLGAQWDPRTWAEPLLAPPYQRRWRLAWSSDARIYGGMGIVDPVHELGWQSAAETATFFIADAIGTT
jgi:maltooligosyltrehalose trehalohydrolase